MRRSVSRVRQKPRKMCVLMTETSPLTGLRRRADNLQPASVAYSDPSGLKNAVTGASLGRTEVYIWRISVKSLRRNPAGLGLTPAQYREKMEPAVRLSHGRAELRGAAIRAG